MKYTSMFRPDVPCDLINFSECLSQTRVCSTGAIAGHHHYLDAGFRLGLNERGITWPVGEWASRGFRRSGCLGGTQKLGLKISLRCKLTGGVALPYHPAIARPLRDLESSIEERYDWDTGNYTTTNPTAADTVIATALDCSAQTNTINPTKRHKMEINNIASTRQMT
jgi:hypothetical protein